MYDNALTNLKGGGDLKDLSSLRVRNEIMLSFLKTKNINRARNNGRLMDDVRTDWGVDQSTFRLAGRVDWSQSIVLKMKSVVSIVISM